MRIENKLKPKEEIELFINTKSQGAYASFEELINKLGFVSSVKFVSEKMDDARSFLIGTDECYVPVSIDIEEEIARIKKELDYNKGFLNAVEKKLSNERFVNSAPEVVVNKERQKQEDTKAKIKMLEESLVKLA